jgi:hypothetical protein
MNDKTECPHNTSIIRTASGDWECAQCNEPFIPITMVDEQIQHNVQLVIESTGATAAQIINTLLARSPAFQGIAPDEANHAPQQPDEKRKSPFIGMTEEESSALRDM